jgi:hypothetical protein
MSKEHEITIATWGESGPVAGHDDKYKTGIKGRRWALLASTWREGVEVGTQHQCRSDSKWHYGAGYYTVSLTRNWRVGYSEERYDGYHCGLSLGFLHINWLR